MTRRSLELTRTLRDGDRQGSLLAVLDRTVTPMGARLLHDWLLAPAGRAAPPSRPGSTPSANCCASTACASDLREALSERSDLQRLTARVSTGRASPRDLAAVARRCAAAALKAQVTGPRVPLCCASWKRGLELCPDLRELLDAALVDEPPINRARKAA